MNRDEWAALVRGTVSLIAGLALFYAIGRYLGWWVVGVIALAGTVDFVWCATRLPRWMRPW